MKARRISKPRRLPLHESHKRRLTVKGPLVHISDFGEKSRRPRRKVRPQAREQAKPKPKPVDGGDRPRDGRRQQDEATAHSCARDPTRLRTAYGDRVNTSNCPVRNRLPDTDTAAGPTRKRPMPPSPQTTRRRRRLDTQLRAEPDRSGVANAEVPMISPPPSLPRATFSPCHLASRHEFPSMRCAHAHDALLHARQANPEQLN